MPAASQVTRKGLFGTAVECSQDHLLKSKSNIRVFLCSSVLLLYYSEGSIVVSTLIHLSDSFTDLLLVMLCFSIHFLSSENDVRSNVGFSPAAICWVVCQPD